MASTLEAKNLSRLFGANYAVKDVSFNLERGEVLGFLGPNGAGKSTTMRMLTGNLAPTEGAVDICGFDMLEDPKKAKSMIGYLPEMRPLYKELTVDEYLTIAARFHNVPAKKINHVCVLSLLIIFIFFLRLKVLTHDIKGKKKKLN